MTKVHLLDRLPLPPIKPVLISPEHAAVVRPLVGKPKICKIAASLDGEGIKTGKQLTTRQKQAKQSTPRSMRKRSRMLEGVCETGYHGVMIC